MTDSLFTWAVGASIGTHVIGLLASSALGLWTPAPPPPPPVPIEVVGAMAPEPPPSPVRPERVRAPRMVKNPVVERVAPAPMQPSTLIDEKTALDTPAPALHVPEHNLPSNALAASANAVVPGLREGGAAGAGALFSTGDLGVKAGASATGGSGATGRAGSGLASIGAADAVAAAGVTSFAKPL